MNNTVDGPFFEEIEIPVPFGYISGKYFNSMFQTEYVSQNKDKMYVQILMLFEFKCVYYYS